MSNVWKQQHNKHVRELKKNKQNRIRTMNQKRGKKQNELKMKGIRSKQNKYKTATFKDKSRSGEISLTENIQQIMSILTDNNCKDSGSFVKDVYDMALGSHTMNNHKSYIFNDLKLEELKDNEPIEFKQHHIDYMQKVQKIIDFQVKYGYNNPVPFDDPKQWTTKKIEQFLKNNNIIPTPKPRREVLLELCKELIKLKSKIGDILVNMHEDDKLRRIGQLGDNYVSSSDSDDGFDIVVDAQESIPNDLDVFMLTKWVGPIAHWFEMSILASTLTTKVFKDMLQSFVVIAR
eukprot:542111_1